jgi:hypothetical protein
MPGYGVKEELDGALPWSWALGVIRRSRNHFIASTRPDRRPHLMPVWGVWCDDRYVFSTGITTVKSENLLKNPAIAVSFEDGKDAVILEGRAEITPLDDVPSFVGSYKEKYDYVIEEGPVWSVVPSQAFAFVEDDSFGTTATKWVWSG